MPKFKGKNSIRSAFRLGRERAKYNLEAFPENDGLGREQIVDFNFAERSLYGKVDRQLNPVIPNEDFIVPIISGDGSNNTVLAMNFVADQFRDLEKHFVRACQLGLITTDDPVLSTLVAKRGYVNPKQSYLNYVQNVMSTYTNEFLKPKASQINSFDDFLNAFPDFMLNMRDIFPVTYSGFQRSSQSSIFSSGLAIDVAGIPFDDDEKKQNLLFDSPAFQYYINLAKQYGFSVNKRNPGVLISDVASPVTLLYRRKYALSSVNSIFSLQYSKTLHEDISLLSKLLSDWYNSFIAKSPFIRTFDVCSGKTITSVQIKKGINNINNNNIINNNIIYLYINIRNIEERESYTNIEIDNIYLNAIRLKKISEDSMLQYIDDQFKAKYNLQDGTLTYYKKKNEKRLDN